MRLPQNIVAGFTFCARDVGYFEYALFENDRCYSNSMDKVSQTRDLSSALLNSILTTHPSLAIVGRLAQREVHCKRKNGVEDGLQGCGVQRAVQGHGVPPWGVRGGTREPSSPPTPYTSSDSLSSLPTLPPP